MMLNCVNPLSLLSFFNKTNKGWYCINWRMQFREKIYEKYINIMQFYSSIFPSLLLLYSDGIIFSDYISVYVSYIFFFFLLFTIIFKMYWKLILEIGARPIRSGLIVNFNSQFVRQYLWFIWILTFIMWRSEVLFIVAINHRMLKYRDIACV